MFWTAIKAVKRGNGKQKRSREVVNKQQGFENVPRRIISGTLVIRGEVLSIIPYSDFIR